MINTNIGAKWILRKLTRRFWHSISVLLVSLLGCKCYAAAFLPEQFGAKGDGITDDTAALRRMFSACSDSHNSMCLLKSGRKYLVTGPLFLWGKTTLRSSDSKKGILIFKVKSDPYLLNIGISARQRPAAPFSGKIINVHFKVASGESGRLIYFWRTDGATISQNYFDLGKFHYSATSSGNDNRWLINGNSQCIRRNLTIERNRVVAKTDNIGSEGIGIVGFRGLTISDNEVLGVGDDPIGVHASELVVIKGNRLTSNDGRLLVNNSSLVEISSNEIARMVPASNGKIYGGISLLYVGYESYAAGSLARQKPPRSILIANNTLNYPEGSIDAGAAIYVYGPIGAKIEGNKIYNNSSHVIASAIHILPAREKGSLAGMSKMSGEGNGMVRGVNISNNRAEGHFPLPIKMTGNCSEYNGKVSVIGNVAKKISFYCDFSDVKENTEI